MSHVIATSFVESIEGHLVTMREKDRLLELRNVQPQYPESLSAQRILGLKGTWGLLSHLSRQPHPFPWRSSLALCCTCKGLIISRNLWSLESVHTILLVQKDPVQEQSFRIKR